MSTFHVLDFLGLNENLSVSVMLMCATLITIMPMPMAFHNFNIQCHCFSDCQKLLNNCVLAFNSSYYRVMLLKYILCHMLVISLVKMSQHQFLMQLKVP